MEENIVLLPIILSVITGLLIGIFLFVLMFLYHNKVETRRIRNLVDYLEQANMGKAAILSATGEDELSKLEDEIYKTVTFLYQTKDEALRAKNNYAENLSNIAHQIKTPITAISLSVQTMQREQDEKNRGQIQGGNDDNNPGRIQGEYDDNNQGCIQGEYDDNDQGRIQGEYDDNNQGRIQGQHGDKNRERIQGQHDDRNLEHIQRQLLRLTRLEEALLVLSRLDAGTLRFQKEEIDVFTVLVLAADNLQELFTESGTTIDIPELGEMAVTADMEWTMEAVINLMKNCMEHNKGGMIHCSYAQNPLYTEILIWDEGEGFCKEDIPHLFERFYRGKNAHEGGIGIGLSLSKEIIERQNGTIRAKNMTGAGACFEIRFYCH